MKKISMMLAAFALACGAASAQTAAGAANATANQTTAPATSAATPAPSASAQNTEIYMQTWFEYGISDSQMRDTIADNGSNEKTAHTPNKAQNYGTFTLGAPNGDKVRLGIRETILPNLKAQAEVDLATMELKQANVAFVPKDGLTLKAGRMNKLFAQTNSATYQKRWQGVSGVYDFGKGYIGFGVGNDIDEKYNTYYPFNLTNNAALVGSTQTQQAYTRFEPAIAFRPMTGKDLSLEIGANGEFSVAKKDIDITAGGKSKDGTTTLAAGETLKPFTSSVSGYVNLYAYGLGLLGEVTYANLEQGNTNQNDAYADGFDTWKRATYFAQASYKIGNATPTVCYVMDSNYTKNDSTINVEVPYAVAKGLVLNPVFSYAISGYNYNDGVYNANSDTHDWTFGLRVDYKFSAKF